MKKIIRGLVLAAVILLVSPFVLGTGCSGDKAAPSFQARLDAALAISDPPARDNALATVAKDAAAAPEVDIVKRAVSKISDPPTHDSTAEAAALKLAAKGKSTEAVEVAKMINDEPARNHALSKLTK